MTKLRIVSVLMIAFAAMSCGAYAMEPPPPDTPPPTEELASHIPPPQTPVETAPGGSIGLLKYLPDGTDVLISDKVVSGLVYIADATSYLYVQEPDRSAGIRVLWDDFTGLSNGCIVDVSGSLTTIDGERVIQASSVTATGLTTTVDPLLITLSDIGGGAAGFQPGVVLRIPTLPNDPLGLNAAGVNNVGLLVQIYGKVTAVESFGGLDDVYFYVDDGSDIYVNPDPEDPDTVDDNVGSDLWDGEHYGVGVSPYALFGYPAYPNVSEGDFVKVVGMVSTRIDSEGRVLPFLRIRGESDVDQYLSTEMLTSPADRVFPETGGSGAVWNLASLPLPIAFDGTQNPPQYPPQAFKIMGDGYLWSWSAINQAGIQLYADSQAPDACLNHVRHAAGYWFRMTEANNIDYKAVSDDITDRWVSIPYTEFNLFGHPLNHEMAWKDLCITDGKRMGGITEAARDLNWVSSIGYWWQNSAQSLQDIGLPDDSTSSEILKSWYGYYMYTYKPVSLIVPGPALLTAPRGSILATVTDGTNPIIGARVYCKYGSAITTSPDGTALIENLLPGDYLVTAAAVGYQSESKLVTVTAGTQTPASFTLSVHAGITVGITADPDLVPPDNVSTSTITVYVADMEGVPLSGKVATVTTDLGTFENSSSSIDVTTDDAGTGQCFLKSSTTGTATVTATCEGADNQIQVTFDNIVAMPTFSPDGGEYTTTQGVTIGCVTEGASIYYTVDRSEPTESSIPYDPLGVVVVPETLTLKARAFKAGYTPSHIKTAVYIIDPGTPDYPEYQQNESRQIPPVTNLCVTDVKMPSTVRIEWVGANGATYKVVRKVNGNPTVLVEETSQRYWVDTTCPLAPGNTYEYVVSGVGGENEDKGLPYGTEGIIYTHIHWTPGPETAIPMTPTEIVASENQTVDSRVDNRCADNRLLDYQFGTNTYRGGLFAGYASDPSKIGRSFVKFQLTQPPAGERLWAGSVNAYYTRSFADNVSTTVGSHFVADDSWDATTLNWSAAEVAAPNLDPANPAYTETVSYDSGQPEGQKGDRWCSWPMFADICSELREPDKLLSVALASTSEGSNGWAYFAKKEYDSSPPPTVLYAHGADHFVVGLTLNPTSVKGGYELSVGTVTLNAPAPANGTVVELWADPDYAFVADSITVPEGQLTGTFIISTRVLDPGQQPVTAAIKAGERPRVKTAYLTITP